MLNSIKVYKAVISRTRETLISVDDISAETRLDFFTTQATLRALAKDNVIHLAAICDSDETPQIGHINGNAKNPESYFLWRYKHRKFEKENNIVIKN
jgi:hypothetical protein